MEYLRSPRSGRRVPGSLDCLVVTPVFYHSRIAAQQGFRHFPAVEIGGSCIHRWRQHIVLERVEQCRCFVVEHAGQQPPDRIHNYCRCQFATTEHIIADRNFHRYIMFADALINAFVVPANDQQVVASATGYWPFSDRNRLPSGVT